MAVIKNCTNRFRIPRAGRSRILALASLATVLAMLLLVQQFAAPNPTALAAPASAKNEPWPYLKCLDSQVEEGDDFRLEVRAKYDTDIFSPTMRVFCYTEPTTADGPLPHQWMENATPLTNGYLKMAHGELTAADGGRDAFSFTAHGGRNYIVEVEGRLDVQDDGDVHYVDNHLVDPSILKIVNQQGVQLMGAQDGGGLLPNWARGYFVPEASGTYFVAVGSGQLEPSGTGHYTIAVRQDDHADDRQPDPEIVIRPGESIEATINSDVSPDHPGLHPWDWAHWGSTSEPLWAVESLDDRDVFRFEIDHEGTYRLEVTGGPDQLGIWSVWAEDGSRKHFSWNGPLDSHEDHYQPGAYHVGVGTTFESEQNTGPYILSLAAVTDAGATAPSP